MASEREELRLITSEADLRVGMLVEVRVCDPCGISHRYMLMGREAHPTPTCGLTLGSCRGWLRLPVPPCGADGPGMCPHRMIAQRRLYEVCSRRDDEAEQDKQHRLDVQLAGDMARARPAVRRERAR